MVCSETALNELVLSFSNSIICPARGIRKYEMYKDKIGEDFWDPNLNFGNCPIKKMSHYLLIHLF